MKVELRLEIELKFRVHITEYKFFPDGRVGGKFADFTTPGSAAEWLKTETKEWKFKEVVENDVRNRVVYIDKEGRERNTCLVIWASHKLFKHWNNVLLNNADPERSKSLEQQFLEVLGVLK